MKVLYLINFAGKAGTEKYVENLIRRLTERGIPCGLCYNVEGELSYRIASLNIPVHQISMKSPFDLAAAKKLAKLCREEGYDVIHAQFPRENMIAIQARMLGSGAEVVFTAHLTNAQPIHWRIWNRIFTPKNRCVIAVCNAGRQVLMENGVPEEKIQVIYNGIDPDQAVPHDRMPLAEFGIGQEPVAIMLTRFSPEKGLAFLCQALHELRRKYSRPFRVLLCGDGDQLPEIRDLVKHYELEDVVVFAGFRTDTKALLAASDLYMNTSENEAMSFAILEAMAQGLPLLATDVGGNRELVETGGTCGLLAGYGDPEGFSAALEQLLESETLRKTLGAQARKKTEEEFNLTRLLDQVCSTYK